MHNTTYVSHRPCVASEKIFFVIVTSIRDSSLANIRLGRANKYPFSPLAASDIALYFSRIP